MSLSQIPSELLMDFNRAAALGRTGRYEEALARWEELLSLRGPARRDQPRQGQNARFLGLVALRRAWTYMDMRRFQDARACFEGHLLAALRPALRLSEQLELLISHGNTLGELQDWDGTRQVFHEALRLADQELGDLSASLRCWDRLLSYMERAERPQALAEECQRAMRFARQEGLPDLYLRAATLNAQLAPAWS